MGAEIGSIVGDIEWKKGLSKFLTAGAGKIKFIIGILVVEMLVEQWNDR